MELTVHLIGPSGSKANPGCCCGGVSCNPDMTLEEAAQEVQRALSAEGFENVSVTMEDPSDPECHSKARHAAESSADLMPLVMINGRVAAYGGVSVDAIVRIVRKMRSQIS